MYDKLNDLENRFMKLCVMLENMVSVVKILLRRRLNPWIPNGRVLREAEQDGNAAIVE